MPDIKTTIPIGAPKADRFDSAVKPTPLPTTTELRYLIPSAGESRVNLNDKTRFAQNGIDNRMPLPSTVKPR